MKFIFSTNISANVWAKLKNISLKKVICENISEIDEFSSADVVFGGHPCQSFSMAGDHSSENDERSSLYKNFPRNKISKAKLFCCKKISGLKQLINVQFLNAQVKVY